MKASSLGLFAAVAAATDLLIPFYQYPADKGAAWNEVFWSLGNNTDLTHTLVISPNNGPGGAAPDDNYAAATETLAKFGNARMIGYVHTSLDDGATRCTRPWNEITNDVNTWFSWTSKAGVKVPIQGIFIDEAPSDSANLDCVTYMRNLTTLIRTADAQRIVVFNPGTVGTGLQPYYDLSPTFIVAFETCFMTPALARAEFDQCDPKWGAWTPYDSQGAGTSVDSVLAGLGTTAGSAKAARTAILVHGFHDTNGPQQATEAVLGPMIKQVVDKGIGAAFFNTAGYHTFSTGPASIGAVAKQLSAANKGK
ncbi:Spherulation-specific family 4-domain-containing protein [Schizothecium vesticola]|uniref:Spherulation-specific family 4-domain-containing protein n=1 Tax=Schizothecium vesticola TaxID=314040 RepID=A0AA40F2R4_9PEZI|nr:Spherulation-specific family 4-domain-containing protein [Schizothecium vesticola]